MYDGRIQGLVSIIVPVFNREAYISKCIESILCQTYEKLELIIIDDGSEDNTFNICKAFKEKDERIVLIHKENGGVSSARNLGLDKARGEFIAFTDSDDTIDKDMLRFLISKINEYDCDIAACGYDNRTEFQEEEESAADKYSQTVLDDKKQIYENLADIQSGLNWCIWNKIYRYSVIKDIKFDESLAINEDLLFNMDALKKADRVFYTDKVLYHYRKNNIGLSRNVNSERCKKAIEVMEEVLETYAGEFNSCTVIKIKEEILCQVLMFSEILFLRGKLDKKNNSSEYRFIKDKIKNNNEAVKTMRADRKILLEFLPFSITIYKIVYYLLLIPKIAMGKALIYRMIKRN